jgi:hypothetical protein
MLQLAQLNQYLDCSMHAKASSGLSKTALLGAVGATLDFDLHLTGQGGKSTYQDENPFAGRGTRLQAIRKRGVRDHPMRGKAPVAERESAKVVKPEDAR